MQLTIMERTFKTYGGGVIFQPLEALVYLEDENFGSALSEIVLTLQFNSSLPFEKQRAHESLRSSYDDFNTFTEKPKITFRRKKAVLEITSKADFASSEEVMPRSKSGYKLRNETYFRDWNLSALAILRAQMIASKSKFKKTDDFNFDDCLECITSLSKKLPATKTEADLLVQKFIQRRALDRSKLSDWELLDEDWSDYHATARDVVPIPELWSISNEFAPNGNDTGADVLDFFEEEKSSIRKSKDNGKTVFQEMWDQMWGESIPEPDGNYDDLKLNDYRKFVVGFAFAFLKHLGCCPEWLKIEALKHIRENEIFLTRESPTWEHLEELKTINKAMVSCLEKAR